MLAVLLPLAEIFPAGAREPVGVSVAVAPDLLTRYEATRVALVEDKLDLVTSGAREMSLKAAAQAAVAP